MMVLWNGEISRPSADNITTVKEINSPFCHAHQSGSQLCYVCITGVFCSCIYVNCVSLMCMCWEGEFVYILQQTNMICMCVCVCVCVFLLTSVCICLCFCVLYLSVGGVACISVSLCGMESHYQRISLCTFRREFAYCVHLPRLYVRELRQRHRGLVSAHEIWESLSNQPGLLHQTS